MPLDATITCRMPLRNELVHRAVGIWPVAAHGPILFNRASVSAAAKRLANLIASLKVAASHLALPLLLAACATEQPPFRWYRAGMNSEQLRVEAAQCESSAFAVPNSSAERMTYVYLTCMEGRGWRAVER